MKKSMIILSGVWMLFVTSCTCNNNNSGSDEEIVLDSLQTAQSIFHDDSVLIAGNHNVSSWIGKALHQDNWNWNKLKLIMFWADSAEKKNVSFTPDFYTQFAPVLRWSPDSSYVLDFGSYGGVILTDKAGVKHIARGGPDTEVSLWYPKDQKKWRILFAGPSTTIIDAQWIDSTDVAMLGSFDEQEAGNADTLLWIMDVKDNFHRQYKWSR